MSKKTCSVHRKKFQKILFFVKLNTSKYLHFLEKLCFYNYILRKNFKIKKIFVPMWGILLKVLL